ncbi:hybrid sensor histidine kinase/response regulator [Fortiea contorta]|uniref:ATP-binding response regulator n=1 Tax=Fortiea contorta TaxID=1892405 RepID=UPI00034DD61D|nr:hybrid sensor histidine kinase/response regulator [Fortiea contorta]
MSTLQYPLYDFLASVPFCLETTTLATVLEIFEQQQCDRLVVVNQQQCPVGLLYCAHVMHKFWATVDGDQLLNLQQPLAIFSAALIAPIQTIPANERVAQFGLRWRYQSSPTQSNLDWALVDADGKFLGLLDSLRLLRLLAKERVAVGTVYPPHSIHQGLSLNTHQEFTALYSQTHSPNLQQLVIHKPLVELLERLPWPLMLQSASGEVVAQNPAWGQQLGVLKDPEGIRKQVDAILAPTQNKQARYPTRQTAKVQPHSGETGHNLEEQVTPLKVYPQEQHFSSSGEAIHQTGLPQRTPSVTLPVNHTHEQPASTATAANHCFWDSQVGTCTCIVEMENSEERIWQFAKIPLALQPEPKITLNTTQTGLCSSEVWLVLATDVTEQQQLCKELAAKNADLIQLNRLKDEFLACISHELKTPLTAVLGLSRLLVDQQLGELNERQARYAGLIHQSGRHLMSVVNDILDLTRMETGQMELTPVPLQIRAVCDRALSEAKAMHSQTTKTTATSQPHSSHPSSLKLSLSIEPSLDQMVADELRLRQMLVHLLSNAFKFTETCGEIGLRVSRWEGWIAFTVWDTGIGIPEHQQHLIFQKFQQLENPLTRQFEGTGLGLVLTRALARLHGGDVSFLSREGKGSQFTLLLPPSPPKTGFSEPEEEETIDAETKNAEIRNNPVNRPYVNTSTPHHPVSSQRLVLVVEAVARYVEDLTEQLKGLGYRVVIARSGTEAVEKARRLQPKAVFLNPLLPLLSGWDVLTLLKSDPATRHIPVIVTATGAEKDQAFANRSDGFLSLPVQHQNLVPLLETLCTVPTISPSGTDSGEVSLTKIPLRILRLVNPELESINPHPSLREHRVIEVDDLDQAELLARVWQFDVILLDVESQIAQVYLHQLVQHPRLAGLPLVTCDVTTTLAASQIPGLSVFPYLKAVGKDDSNSCAQTDALLSVLQIAAGVCCPPSILVVDVTMLRDLPQAKRRRAKVYGSEKSSLDDGETPQRGSEWFQALIQYLQTAGFKAAMSGCWAEVLQQIRHQSVDLLLICLGESAIHKEVLKAMKALADSPFHLPPILILDQRANSTATISPREIDKSNKNRLESIETVFSAICAQILPRSISMEDLLTQVNQALVANRRRQ